MSDPAVPVRIVCLPVGSPRNPYQQLMMDGLRRGGGFDVRFGLHGRRFAVLKSYVRHRPGYIHFDWNAPYYLRPSAWKTLLYGLVFLAELSFLRRILGCRIVHTLHQLEAHNKPHLRLQRFIQRGFAQRCAWIRVMWPSSVGRSADYLGISPDKIRVLPEGSFVGCYPNDTRREDCRALLGLGSDDFVLAFVGNVSPYKGVEALIEAVGSISDPRLRLLVAGRCDDQRIAAHLRELAAADPRVRCWLEMIPPEQIQHYLNAADAAAFPFRKIENSGSVILAMGFARAVIAPAMGVLPERLATQPELLFQPGDLRAAIERAVALGPERLEAIGRRNLAEVERYRWEDFAAFFS